MTRIGKLEIFPWINQTIACSAFGVRFDLRGICELLPAETAALVSRRLSVAGSPAWMTAKAARAFMCNDMGAQPVTAGRLLIDQCKNGFVAARAVLMQRGNQREAGDWAVETREWDIPAWFWENFATEGASSQDWERGQFAGRGKAPIGSCWITLTGVHFAASSMTAMLPVREPAVQAPSTAGIGGRPFARYWDDLWCAIWGGIFIGDFKPTSQADVERAKLLTAAPNGSCAAK